MENSFSYLIGYDNYLDKFKKLLELYHEWNSKINISAIRDDKGAIIKHFYDSLLGNEFLNEKHEKLLITDYKLQILDIGTGGGFPLLPLAITNPDKEFYGLDSVGKKIFVIENITKSLDLKNINLISGRAEDFANDVKYREQFDFITERAFAPWSIMLELSIPFLKVSGLLIAYQTPNLIPEIEAKTKTLHVLGCEIEEIKNFKLPDELGERSFILIRKLKTTDKKYPRRYDECKKNPL